MVPRRLLIACVLVAAALAGTSQAAAQCLYPPCDFVIDNSITVNHPTSAAKCDTIEVVLMPSEGYEMTILYTTGLQFVRGWHEKCGWGAGPCDVGLTAYEWSLTYYGPIHYVFIVNGTDQATFRVDFAKGSWSSQTAYRTDTTTMTILPGDPQLNIGVSASPAKIPADGTSASAVTVQCRTGNCAPASNRQVSLTTTLGTLGAGGATAVGLTTDANGTATATLTAAATPGQATLSATAEGRTATTTVAMSGASLEVDTTRTAMPATGVADASNFALVVATLTDESGSPLAGKTVTFETTRGYLDPDDGDPAVSIAAVTDSNGEAWAALLSSTTAGTATITASYDTLTAQTTVEMVGVDVAVKRTFHEYRTIPAVAFNQTETANSATLDYIEPATEYGTTRIGFRAEFSWKKPGEATPVPLADYQVRLSSPPPPGGLAQLFSTILYSDDTTRVSLYPFEGSLRTNASGVLDFQVEVKDFWKDGLDVGESGLWLAVDLNLATNAMVKTSERISITDNLDFLAYSLGRQLGQGPVWDSAFWLKLRDSLGEDAVLRQWVADGMGGLSNDRLLEPNFDWIPDEELDRNALYAHLAWRWQVDMVKKLLEWQGDIEWFLNGLDFAPVTNRMGGSAAVVIYPRQTTGQTEWHEAQARILDGWIRQEVASFTWEEWIAAQNEIIGHIAGFYQYMFLLFADRKDTVIDNLHYPLAFPANGLAYPPATPEDTADTFAPESTVTADCPVWISMVDAMGRRNGYDPNAAPGMPMLRTDMRTLWWTTLTMADNTSAWDLVLPEGPATIELYAYGSGQADVTLVSRRLGKTLKYQGMMVAAGDRGTLAFDPAFATWPELVFDDGRRLPPVVEAFAALGVSPASGPPLGGTEICVTGADVIDGATVTVGGVPATNVRWLNGTTLAAVTGKAVRVGPVDVVVTNPGAAPVTLAKAFTYETAKHLVDVNADGFSDVVFYRPDTGRWAMTKADGQGGFAATLGQWSAGWTIKPGDFSGDGATDLFFYNGATGAWYVGVNDGQGEYTYLPGTWAAGWTPVVLDLNGDGRADILVYNKTTGAWYQCVTTGPGTFAYHGGQWSPQWELVAAELDGNGVEDLFVYNKVTGAWFRCVSDGVGGFTYGPGQWSPGWDVVAGDWDGDGLSDLLVYHAETGAWYRCRNTGAGFAYTAGQWSPGWQLHVGDFNGDGRADVFVYTAERGHWYECLSTAAGAFTYHGGTWSPGWEVHVMELNGDGQSDVLVYNPASGAYYQCVTTGPGTFAYVAGQWDAGWTLITGVGR